VAWLSVAAETEVIIVGTGEAPCSSCTLSAFGDFWRRVAEGLGGERKRESGVATFNP
jgi:hypothetical protein